MAHNCAISNYLKILKIQISKIMTFKFQLIACFILMTLMSCDNKIAQQEDYIKYLSSNVDEQKNNLQTDIKFWSDKLNETPNQFPYYIKRGGVYSKLFTLTGDISMLKNAESDFLKANEVTNYSNLSYLRALSMNYISQHKFKEALNLLEKAEKIGDQLNGTQKMLFDVHLELGDDFAAKHYLDKIKNKSDFDCFIRMAKFQDHNGDLDAAITYMEKAKDVAESSNLKGIKKWAYTNLADFYGHDGRIEDSYQYFLKALELDPNDAYAKKGIAWIAYANDNNPKEAIFILNKILDDHKSPDYYLLLSEIAQYNENEKLANSALKNYNQLLENNMFGDMYNTYNILYYAEQPGIKSKALELAKIEVENRPTTASYALLAWSYFKNGEIEKAKNIALTEVDGKTSEPEALYHLAEIYKASGNQDRVKPLKQELKGSIFELGPQMGLKINQL